MIKSVYTFTFRKFLSVFVLTFFVKFGFGQVYQAMPQYGYGPVKRFDVDSTLTIPTVCGVPTLKSNLVRKSAIAFDTCNNRFYFYNSKTLVWDTIKGGAGGPSTDTTSLSNRINLKLNISDTASMLLPYLRKIDTTNKWVNSVTRVNDSTIRVVKGVTTTDIVINPQATRLVTEVYNKSGARINKGAVVYINGKHSNNLPSIVLAEGNNEDNSYKTFALVADSIPNMSSGYVIQAGTITGLNLPTNTYTDGDILYLSPTTPGGYTTTKPLAPNHIVKIGSVVNAHPTQGRIEIKLENGWQLDELSDVKIAAVPNDSTLLQFSRVDSLWHDVSPITAIGNRYIKPSDTTSMLTNYAKTSALASKLNISDTSTMLTNYAKTSAINGKLNITDTASMLTNYAKNSSLTSKLNISDTSTMLNKYLRKTDTSTLSSRIDLKQNQLSGTGFIKASGSTISYDNSTYLPTSSYEWMQSQGLQALGSTIKGINLSVPNVQSITAANLMANGSSRIVAYYLPQSVTLTGIKFFMTTSGNYTASNYNGVGLYSYSGGTCTLVASSTNDNNFWVGTSNTWQTRNFSSTYSAASGVYFIVLMWNVSASTTTPSVGGSTILGTANVTTVDLTNSAKINSSSSITTLPSSFTMSTTTAITANIGCWLY